MQNAALGLCAHSGWAVLVVVAGSASDPTLVDRRRIELADRTPAQPYHEAAALRDLAAAAALIDRARDDASRRATDAIATAVGDATGAGYRVRRAALLMNDARPLPALDAILAAHPLLHAAEGELFRSALASGCAALRIAVEPCSARAVFEQSGDALKVTAAALRRRVTTVGRAAGPPWTADHKAAFVAAWRLLR